MKLLLVLVLTGFTACCDAKDAWKRHPSPQVNMVREVVLDYVSKADASLKQIREAQLAKEVNTFITRSTQVFDELTNTLHTQVAPLTQDLLAQFSQEAERLKTRMEKDLSAGPLSSSMDPEVLTAVLQQKSQELKEQLQKNLHELQAQMVSYTKAIKEKMEQSLEELQVNMAAIAQSFESQLKQKHQEIQESLVPYGEELRTRLDTEGQNLKEQLTDLWRSFTKLVQ